MTKEEREEAIKQLEYDLSMCNFNPMTGETTPMNDDCRKSAKALGFAIEALKQADCEDCISREAIGEIILNHYRNDEYEGNDWACATNSLIHDLLDELEKLPSVQPKAN